MGDNGKQNLIYFKKPFMKWLEMRVTLALEPILSRNIIKLQITDNHILSKV